MGIFRLNHAVLFVRDLDESVRFYSDVLGFRRIDMTPEGFAGAAFLQAPGSTNDHDLGLFEIGAGRRARRSPAGRPSASTTWPGRSTPSTSSRPRPGASPRPTRWSARPTTAPPRASTAATPAAWSSRSSGSSPPTCWTTRRARPASASAGSTWPRRRRGTAARRTAASASRCRSRDRASPAAPDASAPGSRGSWPPPGCRSASWSAPRRARRNCPAPRSPAPSTATGWPPRPRSTASTCCSWSPPARRRTGCRPHRMFVDAAAAAGVRHVVYTSFAGAAPDCTFTLGRDHWATEEHLRASGMSLDVPAGQLLPRLRAATSPARTA